MSRINVLDKKIAELIAAGEVIERPASVVKELIENSIDAGAKNICVEIKNGGVSLIRVTDDGCAIQRDDVKKAFLRHATSKVKDAIDLDKISTLGFRGEALASISAVSRVNIITRTKDEICGTSYNIEGSEEGELCDIGCPVGTTIIIKDLFFNTPARMKFLKKDVSEANAVASIVDKVALSHPEISFKFIRDNKECLNTPGDGNIKSAIYSVYSKSFCEDLIAVDYNINNVKVHGFICSPKTARANRNMQHFFINGRYVRSKTAMVALEQAFKGSILVSKFPSCVLYIEVSCEVTDVNVHPSKLEIRFIDERPIFDAVYYAVKSALLNFNKKDNININEITCPKIEPIREEKLAPAIQDDRQQTNNGMLPTLEDKEHNKENKKEQVINIEPEIFVPKKANSVFYNRLDDCVYDNIVFDNKNKPEINFAPISNKVHNETNNSNELKQDSLNIDNKQEDKHNETLAFYDGKADINLIGEAFDTYIILQQDKDSLLFIDKHAAHERLIYEKLKNNDMSKYSQVLLKPIAVTLEKSEYAEILNNRDILSKAGFVVDDFGAGTVLVRSVPTYLSGTNIEDAIIEIAGYFVENRKDIETEYTKWLYHNIACRAAVKAGDKIKNEEIICLVKELIRNPDVKHCPHGRPIFFVFKKKEIEKQFCRM